MVATRNLEGCITHGPWGGSQGEEWVYMSESFIKRITVRHGVVVDSIKFQTYCSNGYSESSVFGGGRKDTICMDYPDEYLVSVSGTIGSYDGFNVVSSICFKTNENRYGPYGTARGTPFSYDGKGGVIVGFHGRSNKYLTAIGVYVMPKSLAFGQNSMLEGKIKNELCSSMAEMVMPREPGPWGASGGKPWDDGVFSTIKQVRVYLGEFNAIYALQFQYMKLDGTYVLSQIHGRTDASKIEEINLDVKDGEYLIGISGYYGPVEGYNELEAIASVSFHTNKRIHGPHGKERGAGHVYYSSTASSGKVAGFHGRDNGFLSAIGVHMEYL